MDISKLGYTELVSLKQQIEVAIKAREKEEKAEGRRKILELARTYGISLDELGSNSITKSVRAPVAPKYAHPVNSSLNWTGRGRKPLWVEELLSSGKTLADLAI